MTLETYYESYLLEHELKPSSQRCLRQTIQAFESWLGHTAELTDLSAETVNKYLVWLQENGRTPATIHSRRRVLLTFWRAAWEAELVDQLPRRVRKIKLPRANPQAWTPDEVRQLVVTCQDTPDCTALGIPKAAFWTSLVLTAWDSALRLGDLLAFERAWIPADGRLMVMQSKTGYGQTIQLRPITLEWINLCMENNRERRCIWPWASRREEFYKAFNRLVRRAGIRKGTFKWLRRASVTAVDAIQRGAGTDQAGHRDRGITLRHYVDASQLPHIRPLPPEVA